MVLSHRRLAAFSPLIAIASIALLGPPGRDSSSVPVAEARGASAEELSAQLSAHDAALRAAIDAWRAGDDPPKAPPPREVMAPARDLQRKVRSLAQHPSLARNTIALLPRPLASDLRALIGASRDLRELSAGWPPHPVKTGEPRSLAELTRYYDGANRRYDVGQHYLAAIHHVESKFGRVKSDSVAGAKGPMQFLPSTWEIYGRGGDIQDPHDAILAAANLLDDNGAPGDYRRALHAYNPSQLYVDAVQRYARLIKRDAYAVYFLYCWGP